jgi:hypothetical protein
MRIIKAIWFLLCMAIAGGCVGDPDLQRSIFVRDIRYPDLPQYSEWGYNTFGAFINEDVFVSGAELWEPASVMQNDTAMILSFHGEKRSRGKDTTDMIMYFTITRSSPVYAEFLSSLNDSVLDLSAASNQVQIVSDNSLYPVTITSGELHFKRVQNLVVDMDPMETIFSGTFEFEGIMDGMPVSVTLGRFDVGVGYY